MVAYTIYILRKFECSWQAQRDSRRMNEIHDMQRCDDLYWFNLSNLDFSVGIKPQYIHILK
jgi:hypothetical protein